MKEIKTIKYDFNDPHWDDKGFVLAAIEWYAPDTRKLYYEEIIDLISESLWADYDVALAALSQRPHDWELIEHICCRLIPDSLWDHNGFVLELIKRNTSIFDNLPERYRSDMDTIELTLDEIGYDRYECHSNDFLFMICNVPEELWSDRKFVSLASYYANKYCNEEDFNSFLEKSPMSFLQTMILCWNCGGVILKKCSLAFQRKCWKTGSLYCVLLNVTSGHWMMFRTSCCRMKSSCGRWQHTIWDTTICRNR